MSDERRCEECSVGIAIVEDEKALVDVYRRIFAKRGIHVCFVAFDGREAVEKFILCMPRPRVILMDHRLPTMTGIEATREILRIDTSARIIFLSADVGVKDEALRAGAVEFLKKPAGLRDILQAVEKYTGSMQIAK
jgi:two-component system chemotaxis response regulator CheY